MLRQSGGARIVAPRQGGRRVGKSVTAVSLLALVGAAAIAPAQAADLGGKVSSNQNEEEFGFRAPDVVNWSGIYVGGHLGRAWGDVDFPAIAEIEGTSQEVEGSLAGGHLGFNHQFGRWVGGVEVSLSGGDVEGSTSVSGSFDDISFRGKGKTEIDSLFLATVRFGYAWNRSLAYVKGGYASADVKLRAAAEVDDVGDVAFSSSERQAGFTLGGGFEYAFTNRVIVGLEYNRVELSNATHVGFATDGTNVEAIPIRVEPDVLHVAMARLSLKFGDEAAELPPAMK
jgi:outer membrane immunogenic protein